MTLRQKMTLQHQRHLMILLIEKKINFLRLKKTKNKKKIMKKNFCIGIIFNKRMILLVLNKKKLRLNRLNMD